MSIIKNTKYDWGNSEVPDIVCGTNDREAWRIAPTWQISANPPKVEPIPKRKWNIEFWEEQRKQREINIRLKLRELEKENE